MRIIKELRKDVQRVKEKLEGMAKVYEGEKKSGAVGDSDRRTRAREREFGAHIGRFGHWV